jgi:electron transport complex protein RnfG
MKNKSLKEILVPAIMLFVIAAVCTALLAGTNLLTKDKIAEIAVQTEMKAKSAVFESAKSFSDEKNVTVNEKEYVYYDALDEKGNVMGYVFSVTVKSYGGDLSAMVGISSETDKITGVEITAISDTPGLGMKATAKDWLSQFIGKESGILVNKNSSSETEIQAITSATITSQAVTDAVNSAFDVLSQVKGGAENG